MSWLLAVLVLAGASANADITYYFGGTLRSDFGTLAAGTQFNGSFSYAYPQSSLYSETLTADIMVGMGSVGYGNHYIPDVNQLTDYIPQYLNVVVGSQQLSWINSSGEARIRVVNDNRLPWYWDLVDGFFILTTTYNNSVGGELIEKFGLYLANSRGGFISSNALVDDSMRRGAFDTAKFYLGSALGPSQISDITYLIPEPSSLSLLLAGGAVLMAGRRKS